MNDDELRKKFTSAMQSGRQRVHSSNNKGRLDSAVLEQVLTSETIRDRLLGKNQEIEVNNEMDFSLSGNVDLQITPDLSFRSRPIRLFLEQEDPNDRTFKHADLHGYIIQNRARKLNAIYSLIRDWVDAGQPSGSAPFASFPEWARVVGGIMHHHKLGDPCAVVQDDGIGGDIITQDMKELFRLAAAETVPCWESEVIRNKIDTQWQQSNGLFADLDLSSQRDKVKFGILLAKFTNRTLGDVTLRLHDQSEKRASRRKYIFQKVKGVM